MVERSVIETGTTVTGSDKVLTLSTCAPGGETRFVVMGKAHKGKQLKNTCGRGSIKAPASCIYGGKSMVNILIPIKGYVHLYRSLLRFYDMPENEIKEMLYLLNTANVDCYGCYHPERRLIESGPVTFSCGLTTWTAALTGRRYSFIRRCMFLKRSVERDMIITAQREALQTLRCILSNIEYRWRLQSLRYGD